MEIEGFEEEMVDELQERAKAALLSQALGDKKPDEDLLNMQGMNEELANKLVQSEVVTMEDLADLSVDELLDIVSMDESRATDLIMQARAPWFK